LVVARVVEIVSAGTVLDASVLPCTKTGRKLAV
jgi:hypothetical protein